MAEGGRNLEYKTPIKTEIHGQMDSPEVKSEGRRGRPRAELIHNLIIEGSKSPSSIKCATCNRVFPRDKSLQAHVRTHTGERPYNCTYPHPKCDKNFAQSGQLKTHERLHTNERVFKCAADGCEARFLHSNRHCPEHPDCGTERSPDPTFCPGTLIENAHPRVKVWLINHLQEREQRTPAKRKSTTVTSTPKSKTPKVPYLPPSPVKSKKSRRGLVPFMEASNSPPPSIGNINTPPSNAQVLVSAPLQQPFTPENRRNNINLNNRSYMPLSSPSVTSSVTDENVYGEKSVARNIPSSPQHARVFKNTQNIQSGSSKTYRCLEIDGIKPFNEERFSPQSYRSTLYTNGKTLHTSYSSPTFTRHSFPDKVALAMTGEHVPHSGQIKSFGPANSVNGMEPGVQNPLDRNRNYLQYSRITIAPPTYAAEAYPVNSGKSIQYNGQDALIKQEHVHGHFSVPPESHNFTMRREPSTSQSSAKYSGPANQSSDHLVVSRHCNTLLETNLDDYYDHYRNFSKVNDTPQVAFQSQHISELKTERVEQYHNSSLDEQPMSDSSYNLVGDLDMSKDTSALFGISPLKTEDFFTGENERSAPPSANTSLDDIEIYHSGNNNISTSNVPGTSAPFSIICNTEYETSLQQCHRENSPKIEDTKPYISTATYSVTNPSNSLPIPSFVNGSDQCVNYNGSLPLKPSSTTISPNIYVSVTETNSTTQHFPMSPMRLPLQTSQYASFSIAHVRKSPEPCIARKPKTPIKRPVSVMKAYSPRKVLPKKRWLSQMKSQACAAIQGAFALVELATSVKPARSAAPTPLPALQTTQLPQASELIVNSFELPVENDQPLNLSIR